MKKYIYIEIYRYISLYRYRGKKCFFIYSFTRRDVDFLSGLTISVFSGDYNKTEETLLDTGKLPQNITRHAPQYYSARLIYSRNALYYFTIVSYYYYYYSRTCKISHK